jgi:hypothetical protein
VILIHFQDGFVSAVTTNDEDISGQEVVILDERPWVLQATLEDDIANAVKVLRAARENSIDNVLRSALEFTTDKIRELSTRSRSEIIDGISEISAALVQARRAALEIENRKKATSPAGITLSA